MVHGTHGFDNSSKKKVRLEMTKGSSCAIQCNLTLYLIPTHACRVYYLDARNFGTLHFVLSATELKDKLDSLGPDLLDVDTTEDVFLDVMNKSTQSRNICKFLMDQGKIAGIG